MPRSLEEIIEHAEELADMFEQLDPDDLRIVPLGEEFLRRAVMARARAERGVLDAVQAARAEGLSWARIGEVLGTSAQAAHQRYGRLVGKPPQGARRGA